MLTLGEGLRDQFTGLEQTKRSEEHLGSTEVQLRAGIDALLREISPTLHQVVTL